MFLCSRCLWFMFPKLFIGEASFVNFCFYQLKCKSEYLNCSLSGTLLILHHFLYFLSNICSPAFSIALQHFQRVSSHFISHSSEKNWPPAFSFALQRKNSHSSKTKWLSSIFILIPAKIIGLQHFQPVSSYFIRIPANKLVFQPKYPLF